MRYARDRFKTRGLYDNSTSRDCESDNDLKEDGAFISFWGIAASATVGTLGNHDNTASWLGNEGNEDP